mgnify:CR=1 FL=1
MSALDGKRDWTSAFIGVLVIAFVILLLVFFVLIFSNPRDTATAREICGHVMNVFESEGVWYVTLQGPDGFGLPPPGVRTLRIYPSMDAPIIAGDLMNLMGRQIPVCLFLNERGAITGIVPK